ncbi:MAG: dienelactone hydrolase family protein [Candidatus Lokiarchaeota archaeon]|nr:dienelactone hydrolase family protein [Candidatus Lokiarchaeota archaeon]
MAEYHGIKIDPELYIGLDECDGNNWEHFDPARWEANEKKYRAHLEACLGAVPGKVPENPVLVAESRQDGYTRYTWHIDVEGSGIPQWDKMPFFVLVPERPLARPAPVMIVHHQHAGKFDKGKEEPAGLMCDPEQALAVDLVKEGYITVAHDALCFSERQEKDEFYTAMKMLLNGRTLGLKYAWDVSRLIDHLETRNDMDPRRIGLIGHSLGGQEAIFCAAYDPRIKVVVSSCGVAKVGGTNSILSENITHNKALYLPGLLAGPVRMDMKEIVGLIHPRPLLMSHGASDRIFPIEGVAEVDNWIQELYAHYGNAEKLVTLRHAGGHYIPRTTKEVIYKFLELNL